MWKSLDLNTEGISSSIRESVARTRTLLNSVSPHRTARFWIFIAALSITGYLICSRLTIVISPSLSKRIFFLERSGRIPNKGEYVQFTFSSPLYENGKRHHAIKVVACKAGDILSVDIDNRFYYCNGRYLGCAKRTSLRDKPLPMFVYQGVIPEGALFVTGAHKDSFDSRYWGFLEEKTIEGIAHPLF